MLICIYVLISHSLPLSNPTELTGGTPKGGEKDEEPPVILKAVPENFSTNFKG